MVSVGMHRSHSGARRPGDDGYADACDVGIPVIPVGGSGSDENPAYEEGLLTPKAIVSGHLCPNCLFDHVSAVAAFIDSQFVSGDVPRIGRPPDYASAAAALGTSDWRKEYLPAWKKRPLQRHVIRTRCQCRRERDGSLSHRCPIIVAGDDF
jgi:hypothetical protein